MCRPPGGCLKRVVPLFLALLALLSVLQHPACCCQPEPRIRSQAIQAKEHDCCNEGENMHSHCEGSVFASPLNASLFLMKDCCGMINMKTLALANSFDLLSKAGELTASSNPSSPAFLGSLDDSRDFVPETNRAPPRLIGFGTSKTYLFKRTLLI